MSITRKRKTMDGNTAAGHVAYAFTDVASIYPITPSSTMAELADKWSAVGQKNVFGHTVKVAEMQSEAGAAGAVHGSLSAGALTTTFTASQGLLLMIPNMYKIAGELLPGVIHCSARAIASHALSIFGDHSDVMSCRQTGFAMLCSGNPQEVMDLAPIAHLAAIKGRVPFLHFFDGFRTSHEMQKIEVWDYKDLEEMLDKDAVDAFRKRALNPEHPVLHGSAENPDVFFQHREACNPYYLALPKIVEEYMGKINEKIGTDYKLFNYYGAADADRVVVAMGSSCDMFEEVVDYLNAHGEKVGLVKVRLFRPFCAERLAEAFPKTVKKIAVLDRTKEPGSQGEPLYLDVLAALSESDINAKIYAGRYGLGSKDMTPACGLAVYENLKAENPKNHFTVGIVDDVTNLSLPVYENAPNTTPEDITSCKFWGLGSDGTVGANKNSIKVIGDNTDMYAQAYFQYDSKKSGGITISHLRFGHSKIKSTYYISKADFVACHNPSYVRKYEMVQDLKDGGSFLLNCPWKTIEELSEHLPAAAKRYMAEHKINFYTIDGVELGREIGLGGRINTILQAAFFAITKIIPVDKAVESMKQYIKLSYGKKGDAVVEMNYKAVDAGINHAKKIEIPADWANAVDNTQEKLVTEGRPEVVDFVNKILTPVTKQLGDRLPVSAFTSFADGTLPQGTAAYEKRGVAIDVPEWIPENCIQCNQCSLVCPHAAIRPYALDEKEMANAPEGFKTAEMKGKGLENLKFSVEVTVMDCMGCGSCANICPAPNKALVMKPLETQVGQQACYDYAAKEVSEKEEVTKAFAPETVKGSQFKQPLVEFSGACAGCGETPYAKLVTQLFGDRMYLAQATGCSSIWGGSSPSTPYTVNRKGFGPAWGNSLFEDNAEFGYGMILAVSQMRKMLKEYAEEIIASSANSELKAAAQKWIDTMYDSKNSRAASDEFISALEKADEAVKETASKILKNKEFLEKKSMWMFGGDGWSYDIGYGGLDHVLAMGEDVNVLIFDTEVYSNTGGQASKASQIGQVAQFASSGKVIAKKDLAQMAMSYGYIYVSQIALGANYAQAVKAIVEAESYHGPSLVIGYAPCINHGIKSGMGNSQLEIKAAVEAGYWHLFRFDPRLKAEGKNPFVLDSKAPTAAYKDFIAKENRYASLKLQFPEKADTLFAAAEKAASDKYQRLVKKASETNG